MARRRGGRGPDYDWAGVCGAVVGADLAPGVDIIGSGSFVFATAGTLVRARGYVGGQLDTAGVDERVLIAMGLIMVSENAAAAGTASVPNPLDDAGEDWIWFGHLWMSSGAEAAVNENSLFDRKEIDSKAMRRVKVSETLVFVASVCDSADMGGTFDLQYGLRILQAK